VTLGGRITLARESANLTDQQLSRRLGVMIKTVRNWETDRSEPRGNKLSMLSGVLGVSYNWLVTGVEDNIENLEETKALQVKMDRLINLHEQSSALIFEIQSDLHRLQNRIDRNDFEVIDRNEIEI
jgi:transcriptional regulator with XRE-family HTH domain